ncbi:hypothetical protein T06_6741 [Trichinella sp. T6]|nr:hypothetical protein T06_6741 [Trichinella sp. T6]
MFASEGVGFIDVKHTVFADDYVILLIWKLLKRRGHVGANHHANSLANGICVHQSSNQLNLLRKSRSSWLGEIRSPLNSTEVEREQYGRKGKHQIIGNFQQNWKKETIKTLKGNVEQWWWWYDNVCQISVTKIRHGDLSSTDNRLSLYASTTLVINLAQLSWSLGRMKP